MGDKPPLRDRRIRFERSGLSTTIAADVMTNSATKDASGLGSDRDRSPAVGFPAIGVPAGFTSDALPVGMELMARPVAEALLFRFAYE